MNGPDYVLDTNVVIGFLSGADWAVSFLTRAAMDEAGLHISAITRMELLGFPQMTPEDEDRITRFLSLVQVRMIDDEIEALAIRIRRQHRMKLPDAIVAATASAIDATLISADTDFERVSDLSLMNPCHTAE